MEVIMAASPENSIPVTVRSANTVVYALRLKPGQDLFREIESFVARERLNAGWIVTCVGSLTQSSIRFANEPTATLSPVAHYEIVSLVGTLGLAGCVILCSLSADTPSCPNDDCSTDFTFTGRSAL